MVDQNNPGLGNWCAYVLNGQLAVDEGLGSGPAFVKTMTSDAPSYNFSDIVTVNLDVDTVGSQNVRLELILRDPSGTVINFDGNSAAASWPITGTSLEPYQWAFALPAGGTSGLWTVTLSVYDVTTAMLDATRTISFAVPQSAAVQPVIGSVAPASGGVGTAISISGQNFIQGATTCTLGGVPISSLVVVNGNTITGVVPTLAVGQYGVACTTQFGTGSLPNAFAVAGAGSALTPVPTLSEPGMILLSILLASGLGFAVRRQKL